MPEVLTISECYQLLGLPLYTDSSNDPPTLKQVRRAFRQKAREVHPDKVPVEQKTEAEAQFKKLQDALAFVEKVITSGNDPSQINRQSEEDLLNSQQEANRSKKNSKSKKKVYRSAEESRNSEKPIGSHWVGTGGFKKPTTSTKSTNVTSAAATNEVDLKFNLDSSDDSDSEETDDEPFDESTYYNNVVEKKNSSASSDKKGLPIRTSENKATAKGSCGFNGRTCIMM